MNQDKAITKINKAGILLVFPITNQKEPRSLWYEFFPRTQMRWEWDESGDQRVADLWHLRTELSSCRDVVYAKWFRGRATFFSHEVFAALLRGLCTVGGQQPPLSADALKLLEILDEDSPQSPRTLRELTGLQGKLYEATFNRALKELWNRLLIVGFGEFDDGAFPSLAIGSSKMLFEDQWEEAAKLTNAEAEKIIQAKLPPDSVFGKFYLRLRRSLCVNS